MRDVKLSVLLGGLGALFLLFLYREAKRAAGEARQANEPVWLAAPRGMDRGLARVEEIVLSALLAGLMLLGVYQAVRRNLLPRTADFYEHRIYFYIVASGLSAAIVGGWRVFAGHREHKAAPVAAFVIAGSLGVFVLLALHAIVMGLEREPLLRGINLPVPTPDLKIPGSTLPQNGFWVDELLRYSVFSIGLLGGALAAQAVKLMNIDMITRLFGLRGRLALRVITTAFVILVCMWLYQGGLVVRAINLKTPEINEVVIKPANAILVLPIGAALIAVHSTLHIITDLYYIAANKKPPGFESHGAH